MNVEFTDNSGEFKAEALQKALKALETCGLTAEGYAKKLCPVDTGNLRNSITHEVDESEPACYVGTNSEYAVYVEMGTGVYYEGGRRTPWAYQDAKGNWYTTTGQKAQPYIKPAVADHEATYRSIIEGALKDG
jgi:HK97 gp10 family phage protein